MITWQGANICPFNPLQLRRPRGTVLRLLLFAFVARRMQCLLLRIRMTQPCIMSFTDVLGTQNQHPDTFRALDASWQHMSRLRKFVIRIRLDGASQEVNRRAHGGRACPHSDALGCFTKGEL
ncbi:hypothetical protein L227DRAFT_366915 [Lentinus tigrinus ALCF2SS1-6]|uniref:Uncharacterized protein n=1 Tax=Lentinus tigrinus ALCF2SS1-6 TaxID=1328759 RepID=A0A5C2SL90_9APHY|nr:hypothetical protein L227DRAFT_366915 [Lentinus tigrinus ALCF2SS1-6]